MLYDDFSQLGKRQSKFPNRCNLDKLATCWESKWVTLCPEKNIKT